MSCLNEYKIIKADSEEWARYHAIYRLSSFNEWMSLSFQGDIDRYKNLDCCYWLEKLGKRVGGAFIKPNILKCIFPIPPFRVNDEFLKALTSYAVSVSDNSKAVVAPDVDLTLIECYKNAGFELQRVEKLMVCATKEYDVMWDNRFRITAPTVEDSDALAKLFFDTYSRNKLQYLADQSYDFQVTSVQVFFNHIEAMKVTNEWSTLVFDSFTNKYAGACIVGFVNGLPYILDFVVHPDFQRHGLGAKIMERTLNQFSSTYPAIRLNVTVGNDAVVFYDKLGFISLAEKGYMTRNIEG